MQAHPLYKHIRVLSIIILSFLAYTLAARLGLELATINKQASPVWPATGIGMSLVLLFGPQAAVGIFFGAFFSNYATGLNIFATTMIAAGNTLESLFLIWVLNLPRTYAQSLGLHAQAIAGVFILLPATLISATIGTFALWSTSVIPSELLLKNEITWWIGDFLGALILLPITIEWKASGKKNFQIAYSQIWKFLLVAVITIGLSLFIFQLDTGKQYLFLIFFAILLAANWLDAFWMHVAALGICVFAVWHTCQGHGPFAGNILNDSLIHLQIFLAGLGITAVGLGGIKKEGQPYRSNFVFLFGWALSGIAFFFSYSSTVSKEEAHFASLIDQSKSAISNQMADYFRMLESGVSFFNASDYVSKEDWHQFARRLLSTNQYPGVEGVGVVFPSSIRRRFAKNDRLAQNYQPQHTGHSVPNLPLEDIVSSPEDEYLITYIEPFEKNKIVFGLNLASEKHRYKAALHARDTGKPTITDEIQLVQDSNARSGFLIFAPIYKDEASATTIEKRRAQLLGFIYSPVVFEKFIKTAIQPYEGDISLTVFSAPNDHAPKKIYASVPENDTVKKQKISDFLEISGHRFEVQWQKGNKFESTTSLMSSWVGFFGTIATLFLAIMLSSLQNLTTRAQNIAEEITTELKAEKRAWKALTETSPIGIFLTDKGGCCTYVNPKWSEITELPLNTALGKGWMKTIHVEDKSQVLLQWRDLLQGGKFECNYRYMKNDGSIVFVSAEALPLKGENNEIKGYFGTVQDVTELQQNQIALMTSARMSSLGQMASGIAHEINNPLAIIVGKAAYLEQLLEKGNEPDQFDSAKAKQQVHQIFKTVHRISKIIKGLQAFARETSNEDFQMSRINDLLDETLELCRERFSHFNVKLTVPQNIDPHLSFWGRSEQVSQVLVNLLNNAFDAASDQPERWVQIDLQTTQNMVRLAVTDSGSGIDRAAQEKIFDPFFTTKAVGKGTGLGLSISKGIMERHGGRLFLDTSKNHTTFVVELLRHSKARKESAA